MNGLGILVKSLSFPVNLVSKHINCNAHSIVSICRSHWNTICSNMKDSFIGFICFDPFIAKFIFNASAFTESLLDGQHIWQILDVMTVLSRSINE